MNLTHFKDIVGDDNFYHLLPFAYVPKLITFNDIDDVLFKHTYNYFSHKGRTYEYDINGEIIYTLNTIFAVDEYDEIYNINDYGIINVNDIIFLVEKLNQCTFLILCDESKKFSHFHSNKPKIDILNNFLHYKIPFVIITESSLSWKNINICQDYNYYINYDNDGNIKIKIINYCSQKAPSKYHPNDFENENIKLFKLMEII